MSQALGSEILAARERLAQGRAHLYTLHQRGLAGRRVSERLSALIDQVASELFLQGVEATGKSTSQELLRHTVLVAHGGNGRRLVAPYSDVDMMILHDGRGGRGVEELAMQFTKRMYDTGLALGHSFRTVAEALDLAKTDPKTCSTLIETRFLTGSNELYDSFRQRWDKGEAKRARSACSALIEARAEERNEYGDTNYLLEPNVKQSAGALRDLHLFRWLALLRHGTADFDRLHTAGGVSKLDRHRLRTAEEFLLRLRNELHFYNGDDGDVLTRQQQARIAPLFGYRETGGLLSFERMMREYYQHTTRLMQIVRRFTYTIDAPSDAKLLDSVMARKIEGDFRIGMREISATTQGMAKVKKHVDDVLRLIELANAFDRRIAWKTWNAIHLALPQMKTDVSPVAKQRFLKLLANPTRLAPLLRQLHELGVLEKLIPAFQHARGLLQANNFHKYTVDEHCIRTVEQGTTFAERGDPLGDAYREITDKTLFHLSLLIHDLGKGFEEDHSVVGARIAEETGANLGLPAGETAMLAKLVRMHLRMSRIALWYDPSDPNLVAQFAEEVGDQVFLRMLYVLTCADISAVGPGVLNDWKLGLITQLYLKTSHFLESGETQLSTVATGPLESAVGDLPEQRITPELVPDWAKEGRSPRDVIELIKAWGNLTQQEAIAHGRYLAATKTWEFLVAVDQGTGRGVFARVAAALAAKEFAILAAAAERLANGTLLIRFEAEGGPDPSPQTTENLCRYLQDAIAAEAPPKIRPKWGESLEAETHHDPNVRSRVKFRNDIVDGVTIVEVYTFDRRGLLYRIAQQVHDCGLVICQAKIATHLDQVVDIFHTTTADGQQVTNAEQLAEIEGQILQVLAQPVEA